MNPALLILSLFFAASTALADWQAKMTTTATRKGTNSDILMDGSFSMKKKMIRMDTEKPMKMTMIVNPTEKKAITLMHQQKSYMDMGYEKAKEQVPQCANDSDIAACFKQQGYKKTGSEKIEGHPCDIYEGTKQADKKDYTIKLWHPTDLKEVFFLKSVMTSTSDGEVMTTLLSNVQLKPLPDSLFAPPAGYKAMGSFQDIMKNAQIPGGAAKGTGQKTQPGAPQGAPQGMPQMPKGFKLPPGVKLPPGMKIPGMD